MYQMLSHQFFCQEILQNIFLQLNDHRQLAMSENVCKYWRKVASLDSIWQEYVGSLWRDKVYVPKYCEQLCASGNSKETLQYSISDSKRTTITRDEFSSFDFSFRFKLSAGPYWTSLDPFWHGHEAVRIRFSAEGSIVGYPEVTWSFVLLQSSSRVESQKCCSFVRVRLGKITILLQRPPM